MIPGLRLFAASVCVAATVWVVTDAATASPPPPDAAPRLAWSTARVERSVLRWHRALNPEVAADGVRLVDQDATCIRTRRVPARYRCDLAALWIEDGDWSTPLETRAHLTRCYPNRRIRVNAVDYDHGRARIVVQREGRMGGGLVCRYAQELADGAS